MAISRTEGRTSGSDFRQTTTDEDTIGGLTEIAGLTRRLTVHVEFSREQLEFGRPGGSWRITCSRVSSQAACSVL